MEEGGLTSHSQYIEDNSPQCQGGYFVSLDWSEYNVQTDTIKHMVKKDTFIVGQYPNRI